MQFCKMFQILLLLSAIAWKHIFKNCFHCISTVLVCQLLFHYNWKDHPIELNEKQTPNLRQTKIAEEFILFLSCFVFYKSVANVFVVDN